MRHKDLIAGTEYLHNNTNEWRANEYRCHAVTVLSTERFSPRRSPFSSSEISFTDFEGNERLIRANRDKTGLYVAVLDKSGTVSLALITHLRGEWEPTIAEVREAGARRKAIWSARVERQKIEAKRAENLRAEVNALLGHEAVKSYQVNSIGGVTLSLDVLEALLTTAKAN